jgi:glycosyltransferase EpsH
MQDTMISVIIPVYNVEQYLHECMESIINQTHHALDIILIDDGSTDNSGKICDEYAAKDDRIVVVHQENQGLAGARNCGIGLAKGEYVIFVDSDDWIDLDTCEQFLKALVEHHAQSAMCAYIREYPDNALIRTLYDEDVLIDGKYLQRRLCGPIDEELRHPENLDCYSMMCGKLYPRKALVGRKVTDTKLIGTEDNLYNFELFFDIENMIYVNQPYYHYRHDVRTSLTTTYKPNLDQQWNTLYGIIEGMIHEHHLGEVYTKALHNRIALNIIGCGLNCVNDRASLLEKYKRVRTVLKTNIVRRKALKQLSLQYMPLHWKAFFLAAKCNCSIMVFALLLTINRLRGTK